MNAAIVLPLMSMLSGGASAQISQRLTVRLINESRDASEVFYALSAWIEASSRFKLVDKSANVWADLTCVRLQENQNHFACFLHSSNITIRLRFLHRV
jgi:hypothetical protein